MHLDGLGTTSAALAVRGSRGAASRAPLQDLNIPLLVPRIETKKVANHSQAEAHQNML